MKRITAAILSVLLLLALAGCGSDSTPAATPTESPESTQAAPSGDKTPFFEKEYAIDENTLTLKAAHDGENIAVAAEFAYDPEKPQISNLLYMTTLVECMKLSEKGYAVTLTAHDSTGQDSGFVTFADGVVQTGDHPAVYDPDYDLEQDESLDQELFLADYYAILTAFVELEAAQG